MVSAGDNGADLQQVAFNKIPFSNANTREEYIKVVGCSKVAGDLFGNYDIKKENCTSAAEINGYLSDNKHVILTPGN